MQTVSHEPDLDDLIRFLQAHSQIFETPNYEFLTEHVYKLINQQWLLYMSNLNYEQLSRLPTAWTDFQDCPSSLKHFFAKASELTGLADCMENKEDISFIGEVPTNVKGIKPKKLHELTNFSGLVKEECVKLGVHRVVDVGCGLGHMLDFLNKSGESKPLDCLGIETNQEYCFSARKRYGDSANIQCVHFGANDSQIDAILSAQSRKTALISLHGCGDLQPMLLEKFVQLQHVNNMTPLLLTIGCCYHKMSNLDAWPMSMAVKQSLSRLNNPWRPTLSAFRLACQEQISRWKAITGQGHESHKQNFMNRAIVECFYRKMGISCIPQVKGFNRKLGKSLEELETSILRRNNITCHKEKEKWRFEFRQICARYEHLIKFVEPFTALQFALQGVLETLVLLDRVFYLREHGVQAGLKAVFNSHVSPRNMCVVAGGLL